MNRLGHKLKSAGRLALKVGVIGGLSYLGAKEGTSRLHDWSEEQSRIAKGQDRTKFLEALAELPVSQAQTIMEQQVSRQRDIANRPQGSRTTKLGLIEKAELGLGAYKDYQAGEKVSAGKKVYQIFKG